jgi:hypothetical protein
VRTRRAAAQRARRGGSYFVCAVGRVRLAEFRGKKGKAELDDHLEKARR